MSRSIAERLLIEMRQIREELRQTVSPIADTDLDYAPAEGMKGYRALLQEIGAMQAETMLFLTTGKVPEWSDCGAMIHGDTFAALLETMDAVQSSLTAYLQGAEDDELRSTLPMPEEWVGFFETHRIEREELVRWVCRHEYYHLGQIVTYRWIQGHNPYRSET